MFGIQYVFAQLPYTLSGNETWGTGGTSVPPAAANGVIVGSHKLIINSTTVTLNTTKTITIALGGTLEINSGTVTSSTTWGGIIANGGSGTEQYSTPPDPNTLNSNVAWEGVLQSGQTLVKVTGSSHINNAVIGITSNTGAIVQTTDGEFLNCEVGILINTYTSPTNPHVNACRMMGTTLKWNDSYPFNVSNIVGIEMDNVRGVNFGGCKFINDISIQHDINDRGIGMLSNNSNFGLAHQGSEFCSSGSELICLDNCQPGVPPSTTGGIRNSFTKLSFGIKQLGSFTGNNGCKAVIKFCDFTNNLNDIFIENGGYSFCQWNSFSKTRSSLDAIFGGGGSSYTSVFVVRNILTTNSFPILIINNNFSATAKDHRHIEIDASSSIQTQKSKIRSNTFTNSDALTDNTDQVFGLFFTGGNNNIEIHCNTFNNIGIDIHNDDGALSDFKIGLDAVKNTFSSIVSGRFRLSNDGNTFDYIHLRGLPTPSSIGSGRENPNVRTGSSTINLYTSTTVSTCTITCQEMQDDAVNISNISKAYNSFKLFPNPVSQLTNLTISNGLIKEIRLFSMDGKLLKEIKSVDDYTIAIDVSNLSEGMYIIVAIDNYNNTIPQKLIKH